jgi:hypothetical protein
MSVSKYKFVSPGVFVNEIDNSQLPAATRRSRSSNYWSNRARPKYEAHTS